MNDILNKLQDILFQSYSIFQNKELNFYCKKDQDTSGFILSLFCGLLCYILSKITGNFSWVDRLWSIVPSVYMLHFIFYRSVCEGLPLHERQFLMFVLSTLWSIRLTYNFYRKGGYSPGGEDYRWQVVKKDFKNPFLWEMMNIFFISFFQNILLYLLATPASFANSSEINKNDYIIAFVFLGFLLLETIADQQQWIFQGRKQFLKDNQMELTGDFKRGFLSGGLFRYSRHPNFFAEMSLWWIIYSFSINATGFYLNWTFLGTAMLTILFQASTDLTEKISVSKYPEYQIYQKTTWRFIPWMSGFDKEKKE